MEVGEKLLASVGQVVTIEFSDGEVVDARISAVDIVEHDDVIYDLVEVRVPGAAKRHLPQLYRASLSEITSVSDRP